MSRQPKDCRIGNVCRLLAQRRTCQFPEKERWAPAALPRHYRKYKAWPGNGSPFEVGMSSDIEIYEDQKIIRRTVSGELHTKRSLRLVREMSVAIKLNKGYNLLIDLRDTVTRPETLDLMEIATACSRYRYDFKGKIAFLIPDTDERNQAAKLFRTCMEAQGFAFQQFFHYEAAMEWLFTKR